MHSLCHLQSRPLKMERGDAYLFRMPKGDTSSTYLRTLRHISNYLVASRVDNRHSDMINSITR